MSYSYSIIVESANLGMSEFGSLKSCVVNLKAQISKVKGCQELVILLSDILGEAQIEELKQLAPEAILHQVTEPLAYLFFKLEGVPYCSGDLIFFIDMDIELDPNYLTEVMGSFAELPEAAIISAYATCPVSTVYEVAMASTWIIKTFPRAHRINLDHNFNLNNFAIKREVLLQNTPEPLEGFYRASSMIWKETLRDRGHLAYIRSDLRAEHEIPSYVLDGFARIVGYSADRVQSSLYHIGAENKYEYKPSFRKKVISFLGFNRYHLRKALKSITFLWKRKDVAKFKVILALPLVVFNSIVVFTVSLLSIISNKPFVRLVNKFAH